MRRSDREMSEEDSVDFIKECKVCRIAMQADGEIYLVPLNFGYRFDDGRLSLYFHSAKEGRKLAMLKKNPQVCFEMDGEHRLVTADIPCKYGFAFASVIGTGKAEFIDDVAEKCSALRDIMAQQTGKPVVFTEKEAATVCVFKVIVASFSGKKRQ